jgi:glutathione S-transferase
MKLYGSDLSPFVQRVKMQAAAKGLTLEQIAPPGGMKSDEYLAINPIGKVPCLKTDEGFNLPESEVIVEYLEDRFKKPALRGSKPEDKATARLISRMADLYLMGAVGKLFTQFDPATRDQAVIKAALADTAKALGHIESFMSGKKHAAGAKFTTADCSLTPHLFFVDKMLPMFGVKKPFAATPKLAKYWKSRAKHEISAKAIQEMADAMKKQFGM